MFVDSDDQLKPNAIEAVCGIFVGQRPSVLLYDFEEVDLDTPDHSVILVNSALPCYEITKEEAIATQYSLCLMACHRSLMQRYLHAFHFRIGEDVCTVLPVLAAADHILKTDTVLYRYVRRSTSITRTREYQHPFEIFEVFDYLAQQRELGGYAAEVEWQAISHILQRESYRLINGGLTSKHHKNVIFNYMEDHFPHWRYNKYLKSHYLENCNRFGFSFVFFVHGWWTSYRLLRLVKGVIGRIKTLSQTQSTTTGDDASTTL